jgi:hypothetical protein
MSVITTSAPARAKASASARPNPREPPVTKATFPSSEYMNQTSFDRDPHSR